MSNQDVPHLDLYNFAEVDANDCPYVLTSPRSLQACAKFGIKPMNLLPQSFEEFEEDFMGHEDVYIAFKKHEKDRLKCLHLCREERERIIDQLEVLNDNHGDGESDEDSDGETGGWFSLNEKDKINKVNDEKYEEEQRKPNILSFFEARNKVTPRSHPEANLKDFDSDEEIRTRVAKPTFQMLNGSDSEDDHQVQPSINSTTSFRDFPKHSQNIDTPKSFSDKSPLKLKKKRPNSRQTRKDDLSIDQVADSLPKHIRENLSLMSATDKKLLKSMLGRASEERLSNRSSIQNIPKSIKSYQAFSPKNTYSIDEGIGNDEEKQDLMIIQGLRMSNQKGKRQGNMRKTERDSEIWDEFSYRDNLKKLERQVNDSKNQFENTRRMEQKALVEDIEFKHEKATLQFQHLMQEKDRKRSIKSAKERERKERQEKHLKSLQEDLEAWQQELKDFQDINIKRAETVVEKRNTKRSRKAHNNRLQKELDHLNAKDRLQKEEEMRREELKTIIAMKDERSKVINSEKEEYKKMSQEAARASRAVRDIIKEKTIKSSFDKMAVEAERIARLEKLGRTKPPPKSLDIKHNSSVVLG